MWDYKTKRSSRSKHNPHFCKTGTLCYASSSQFILLHNNHFEDIIHAFSIKSEQVSAEETNIGSPASDMLSPIIRSSFFYFRYQHHLRFSSFVCARPSFSIPKSSSSSNLRPSRQGVGQSVNLIAVIALHLEHEKVL